MHSLFEKQDSLNSPIEAFISDTSYMVFPVRPHWHYFVEVILVLEGKAEITCDDRSYIVSAGEFILLTPLSVHSVYSVEQTPPRFAGIKFDPAKFPNTTSYAPSVSNILRYARKNDMQIHFTEKEASELCCREIFDDCVQEAEGYRYGRDIMLRANIYRLIFGIVRKWMDQGLDINSCPVNSDEIYGIENITEYIDSRLDENIRVADIAEKCHMSYSGFAAKFREQYGMSCKEYIERMRIFKSEEYLLFTNHDLAFISRQSGFSDTSHFIRSFRKYRSITPKQFRLQKKQPK